MAENTSPAITMTCEVCSEYYTDPLMLPCLHSFCKKCLIKVKEKQGSADTSLKCPTCDTSVNLPDGKIEGLTQNLWFEHKSRDASIKKKIVSKEAISCDECSVDDSSDAAVYFSATTGQYIGQFGHQGNGNGQFCYPIGMSTDGKGNILAAEYSNNRVQVFKEDGTFVQVIQCDGNATDVAVDNEGKIHITIQSQHHV
uniref:RING-type domain-containing protein n=1 Tax=Amphimedon queenslandica TaxID=400682 RepID=A0A1X7TH27_AMPQE